jgi:hypothetical protein
MKAELNPGQFRFVWRKAVNPNTWHAKTVRAQTPEDAIHELECHLREGPGQGSLKDIVLDHMFLQGTHEEDPIRRSLRDYPNPFAYDYANVVYPASR